MGKEKWEVFQHVYVIGFVYVPGNDTVEEKLMI